MVEGLVLSPGGLQRRYSTQRLDQVALRYRLGRQVTLCQVSKPAGGPQQERRLQESNTKHYDAEEGRSRQENGQVAYHQAAVQRGRQHLTGQHLTNHRVASQTHQQVAAATLLEKAKRQAEQMLEKAEHHSHVQAPLQIEQQGRAQ